MKSNNFLKTIVIVPAIAVAGHFLNQTNQKSISKAAETPDPDYSLCKSENPKVNDAIKTGCQIIKLQALQAANNIPPDHLNIDASIRCSSISEAIHQARLATLACSPVQDNVNELHTITLQQKEREFCNDRQTRFNSETSQVCKLATPEDLTDANELAKILHDKFQTTWNQSARDVSSPLEKRCTEVHTSIDLLGAARFVGLAISDSTLTGNKQMLRKHLNGTLKQITDLENQAQAFCTPKTEINL